MEIEPEQRAAPADRAAEVLALLRDTRVRLEPGEIRVRRERRRFLDSIAETGSGRGVA